MWQWSCSGLAGLGCIPEVPCVLWHLADRAYLCTRTVRQCSLWEQDGEAAEANQLHCGGRPGPAGQWRLPRRRPRVPVRLRQHCPSRGLRLRSPQRPPQPQRSTWTTRRRSQPPDGGPSATALNLPPPPPAAAACGPHAHPPTPPSPARRAAIAKDGPPAIPFASLYEMFQASVAKYPDNNCLGHREGPGYAWMTYKQTEEQVGAGWAAHLRDRGSRFATTPLQGCSDNQ